MNVIPIPTAQENNGLRNFMYVTVCLKVFDSIWQISFPDQAQ